MVNGTVMPLMCIVFGEMTDSFIYADMAKHNTSDWSEFLLEKMINTNPD